MQRCVFECINTRHAEEVHGEPAVDVEAPL